MIPSLLWISALGCGTPEPTDTSTAVDACEEQLDLTWSNWGDGFFADYCRSCHSVDAPNRFEAPEGIDFDTEAEVIEWQERIHVRVLDEQTMPLGGGVHANDLEMLETYMNCTIANL